jgi:hypothetical protein
MPATAHCIMHRSHNSMPPGHANGVRWRRSETSMLRPAEWSGNLGRQRVNVNPLSMGRRGDVLIPMPSGEEVEVDPPAVDELIHYALL